jgi:hypothetical protein
LFGELQDSSKLEETVAKHMKYQDYLESVHQMVPEDYPEITDLLNRYKTLHDTHNDLTQIQQENEALNEKNRQALHSYTKEQLIKITTFNTELAALQSALELAEGEASKLQESVEVNIQSTASKTLELGRVIMAVENLLLRCTSKLKSLKHDETKLGGDDSMKSSHVKQVDDVASKGAKIVNDLDVICAYVLDFMDIVENCPQDKRDVIGLDIGSGGIPVGGGPSKADGGAGMTNSKGKGVNANTMGRSSINQSHTDSHGAGSLEDSER